MQSTHTVLLAVGLLLLSGCASTTRVERDGGHDLMDWTEQELAPYLAKQLGQHPRFKGHPFLLVDMQGDDVQAQIDALTGQVRERVIDTLLQTQGVNLVWRPSVMPWRHHRGLAEVHCADYHRIRYYIGFDIKAVGNQHQLSVRALDLKQGRWVTGFGRSWRGRLEGEARQALGHIAVDEYLRGLRPLPFSEVQADLAAAYLARNLSCLLRQREVDRIRLFAKPGDRSPAFFDTTLQLVVNYLSRFREVTVTQSREGANVLLQGESHRIDGELYQFWIQASLKQQGELLSGMDADVYVRFEEPPPLALHRPRPAGDAGYGASQLPASRKSDPATRRPSEEPANLIGDLRIITPIGRALCQTDTPWALGARPLAPGARLPVDGCFALEVRGGKDAEVFLFNETGAGRFYRLLPAGSGKERAAGATLYPGETLRFPDYGVMELEPEGGDEIIHAIAVYGPQAISEFRGLAQELSECCEQSRFDGRDSGYWRSRIGFLVNRYRDAADWRQTRIRVEP